MNAKNTKSTKSKLLEHKAYFAGLVYDHSKKIPMEVLGFSNEDIEKITCIDLEKGLTKAETAFVLIEGVNSSAGGALVLGALMGDLDKAKELKATTQAIELVVMSCDELYIALIYAGCASLSSSTRMSAIKEIMGTGNLADLAKIIGEK